MIDPYRMVFVNVASSIFTILGIIIYTKIFKRKLNLFYLLLILSLLPLISVLRKGSYQSGDLSLHAKFAMQFYENLQQGNLIPYWIQNHCSGGYGCPVYTFLFILPYYLISFFHFLGLSFVASVKLLISLSFITSGVGMYYWIKEEINDKSAFVASIFYLYSPYHLIDLHFRVSIGELLSMALLPFQFLFMKRLAQTNKSINIVANASIFALLILSHQVTSFLTLPLAFFYGLLVWSRNKKRQFFTLIMMLSAFVWGGLLTAFYSIPLLFEGKFIQYSADNDIGFHPLSSFVYSPNRFGLLFQGHYGEFYFNVGYVQWFVVIIAIYLLYKKKFTGKNKQLLWYSMGIFVVFFFMMQSVSKPIWEILPMIKNFQFSWRLLLEIMFVISIMAALVVKIFPNKIFFTLLCSLTILYTILNWGNRKAEPTLTDSVLRKQTLFHEYPGGVDLTTPKWVDKYKQWIGKPQKNFIEPLSGQAKINIIKHDITHHQYSINATSEVILKDNTFYFPGWSATANNQPVPINYADKTYPGVITFSVPNGISTVDVRFSDTLDKVIGKIISVIAISFLFLFSLLIFKKRII